MADLVSHPDEIKVVTKRFGQGATNLDRYLDLDGYKAVQKALTMTPDEIINLVKAAACADAAVPAFPPASNGPSYPSKHRNQNTFYAMGRK